MAYESFSPRLKSVAIACEKYARQRYGRNGFKIAEEIADHISWRPTFFHKPTSSTIHAYEVADKLYPVTLKIAAADILNANIPISVYVVCPLDVYVADTKQEIVKRLHADGYGIITVDEQGIVTEQKGCCPLAQHISDEELATLLRGLNPALKVLFRRAHHLYINNPGQGLQLCGQVVEGMVNELAEGGESKGWAPKSSITNRSAADSIDLMYAMNEYHNYRAALGGARQYIREYRNVASHAPRTASEAAKRIQICKSGFIESARTAGNLLAAAQALGIRVSLHIT